MISRACNAIFAALTDVVEFIDGTDGKIDIIERFVFYWPLRARGYSKWQALRRISRERREIYYREPAIFGPCARRGL